MLMNIPYADFYAAEVTDASGLDAVASATLMKPQAGSLAGGSYHTDPAGSDISGVIFPVYVEDAAVLPALGGIEITDDSSEEREIPAAEFAFTGTFDGQGHTIRNLTVNQPDGWSLGLFGVISGCGFGAEEFTGDTAENVTITAGDGCFWIGGITGYAGGFENPDFGVPVTAVRQCSTKNVTITAGADAEGVGDIVGSGFYNAQAAEMRGEPFDKPAVFVITDCKTE